MGNICRCTQKKIKTSVRIITPAHAVRDGVSIRDKKHPNFGYASNRIKTTKYTLLTFLPKNLFEQFRRVANLYFICIAGLNWIPAVAAVGKEVSMVPVILVLTVTAVKDAIEDYRRYKSDRRINQYPCRIYNRETRQYEKSKWHKLRPGDFVHLSCNEIIPADIILLSTSDPHGVCFTETSNIDGETNLKQRHTVPGFEDEIEIFDPCKFDHAVEVEIPNADFSNFRGSLLLRGGEKVPISSANLLLRGCVIRNTDCVEGMVVYAGHESKAMLNNSGPRSKWSGLEHKINRNVILCVALYTLMCLFCAIGSGIWLWQKEDSGTSIPFLTFDSSSSDSPLYLGFLVFWTYTIIFQHVIPQPLYVSVELVKLGQVYFINQDMDLFHQDSNRPMECRALNITEDLGQVEYIFSDKTGTLTENKMEFKTCSIGGVDYPHKASQVEECHKSSAPKAPFPVNRATSVIESLALEPELQDELSKLTGPQHSGWISASKSPHTQDIHDFFLLLAVCNTVVTSTHAHSDAMDSSGTVQKEGGETGDGDGQTRHPPLVGSSSTISTRLTPSSLPSEGSSTSEAVDIQTDVSRIIYEAESPDELALVKAANTYHVQLLHRTQRKVTLSLPNGDLLSLKVLHTLEFDAVRKRMSVILQDPSTQEITLYTKGADSAILDVLDKKYKEEGEFGQVLARTLSCINNYAMQGLRTLCMAKRKLSEREYQMWLKHHMDAEGSMDDGQKARMDSICAIEQNLELLGATGIEDQLQEGVPEAIQSLQQAGICVWVLTGDKQETAIQIAYATHLFSIDQEIITLNATDEGEMRNLLKFYLEQTGRDVTSLERRRLHYSPEKKKKHHSLVVDGKTLAYTLTDTEAERDFIKLCQTCSSVICCRTTPIQKANVVKMVQTHLHKMTLAIGDGANDVSMIQSAGVGVGISGQEGMQAVMASDFAIARFRFLEKLLLVHGHWSYHRLVKFADFMFYKGLVSVFVVFWYQLFSGFSGLVMIDGLYLMLEHSVFTSVPPVINGVFDKPLSSSLLLSHPQLYRDSQKGKAYTVLGFILLMLDSLYQSAVLYFIPHLSYDNSDVGVWEFGTTITVSLIVTILLYISLETSSWTWIQWVCLALSFVVFWMTAVISNAIFFTTNHPSNPYFVMQHALSDPVHTLIIVVSCVLALAPRFTVHTLQTTLWPDDITKVKRSAVGTPVETENLSILQSESTRVKFADSRVPNRASFAKEEAEVEALATCTL